MSSTWHTQPISSSFDFVFAFCQFLKFKNLPSSNGQVKQGKGADETEVETCEIVARVLCLQLKIVPSDSSGQHVEGYVRQQVEFTEQRTKA